MDLKKFQALLADPAKTKQDLMTMRENAIRINAVAHVHAADAALEARFPRWQVVKSRKGRSKAITVTFQGTYRHFDSEKDAYVWLIERFVQNYPRPFLNLDWQTVFVAKGPRAVYFAKSLRVLFGDSQHLADDPNKYWRLSNGWYAKLVLSEAQKLRLLAKFAIVAGLQLGVDWDWNSLEKKSPRQDANELLRELDGL